MISNFLSMKKITLYIVFALIFFSCKENYFDGNFQKLHDLVLNGNELIKTEKYYGDDFGRFHINELFVATNGKIYYRAAKYIDRESNTLINSVGELDVNGNMLWNSEQVDFRTYGFVEDDKGNVYVFGTNKEYENGLIGRIENQSINVIYKDVLGDRGIVTQFTTLKYLGNNTFFYVGIYPDKDNNSISKIGEISINQDNVSFLSFLDTNYFLPTIYTIEKTKIDTYYITDPYTINNQWKIEKSEIVKDELAYAGGIGYDESWNSDPIITDNKANPNLGSSPALGRNQNLYVKNGNDLVAVGYGDNADGTSYTDNNYKIPRGVVACLDYQTGEIKWKRVIPESNPDIAGTAAYQILLHNDKYYVIGEYDFHSFVGTGGYNRMYGYGFVQTISLSGELLDCYLFGKDFEESCFYSVAIVGNKLIMAGYGGQKFYSENKYNNMFVSYDGYKAWFVSCNIDDF